MSGIGGKRTVCFGAKAVEHAFSQTNPKRDSGTARWRRQPPRWSAFPKSVPDCAFPKLPLEDGKSGIIVLNGCPLSRVRNCPLQRPIMGASCRSRPFPKRNGGREGSGVLGIDREMGSQLSSPVRRSQLRCANPARAASSSATSSRKCRGAPPGRY
jgi:hypothetical protein